MFTRPEAIRDKLGPIFDKYRVDIAIQGHAHVYERTVPVYSGSSAGARGLHCPDLPPALQTYANPRSATFGTIWLTTGGGGTGLSAISGSDPVAQSDVVFDISCTISAFHVTRFTVTSGPSGTPEKITIEAWNKDWQTLDDPLDLAELTKTLPAFWRGIRMGAGSTSDASFFSWLFPGATADCVDAPLTTDDGQVDISDGTRILAS